MVFEISSSIPDTAASGFFQDLNESWEDKLPFRPFDGACLAEYIYWWLITPQWKAAEGWVAGSFEIWQTTVTVIIDIWHKDRERALRDSDHGSALPRQVTKVFCDEPCDGRRILDRYAFEFYKVNH